MKMGLTSVTVKVTNLTKSKKGYELANGDTVEYNYGFARINFMGSETVSNIIFGPENVESILDVVALESTGIGIDPLTNTLKKFPATPLKYFRNHLF
jgi:predicted aspartyl protease